MSQNCQPLRASSNKVFLAFIFVCLLFYCFISYFVFDAYPFSMDEYAFLYSAKIFSNFKLWLDLPQTVDSLIETYVIANKGALFAKYPPGFPLVLALGELLNVPFLINPLISCISLCLLYRIVSRITSTEWGIVSAVLLGLNPYYFGYASSYFSQPFCLLSYLLLIDLLQRFENNPENRKLILLGSVLAFFLIIRPIDSALASLCICIYFLSSDGFKSTFLKWKMHLHWLLPYCTMIIAFTGYNALLTGRFSIAVYPIFSTAEFKLSYHEASGFFHNLSLIASGYISSFQNNLKPLILHSFIPLVGGWLILLYAYGLLRSDIKRSWKLSFGLAPLTCALLYNFHPTNGWPQYGARYYYPTFGILIIFATLGLKTALDHFRKVIPALSKLSYRPGFGLFSAFILICYLPKTYNLVSKYGHRFDRVSQIQADISAICGDSNVIIALQKPSKNPGYSFFNWTDFRRNPFHISNRLVIVDSTSGVTKLKSLFPDYKICKYQFDKDSINSRKVGRVVNDFERFNK